ncbi:DUF7837 family putative zinc-binding protein [Haladaptatus halobius]
MANCDSILGTCPFCRATIPTSSLRIEYEAKTVSTVFAECPGCREVVQPE